jgi:hypothetical protein
MNIDGLKGLLIAGTLLFATAPTPVDARTDGNTPVQLCQEKAPAKSEAGCQKKASECGKSEGDCCNSPKVSQKPDDEDSSTTGGSGAGDGNGTTDGAGAGTSTGAATSGPDAAEAPAGGGTQGEAGSAEGSESPTAPAGEADDD